MTQNGKTRLLILGSCVSRDVFAMCPSTDFEIGDYYARSSFATLNAAPSLNTPLLERIDRKFARRMVMRDMDKSLIATLREGEFDLIFLDFIDDRFDTLLPLTGGGLSLSSEYVTAAEPPDMVGRRLSNMDPEWIARWHDGFARFKSEIVARGWQNRVVVNQTFWATRENTGRPIEGPKLAYIEQQNAVLARSYDAVRKGLPQAIWLDYQPDDLVSDAGHKWGPAPFYYVQCFYDSAIAQLRDVAAKLTPIP